MRAEAVDLTRVAKGLALLGFLGLLPAGCAPGADGPGQVESTFQRRGVLQEELRIDGHDADLLPIGRSFASRSVAVGQDGRIFVIQRIDQNIRVFDEHGMDLGGFGGRGAGPGEFTALNRIAWRADTL